MTAEQRKSTNRRKMVLYLGGSMAVGAALGFAAMHFFMTRMKTFHPSAWVLVWLVLAYFPVLALHEAGHALVGMALGFDFRFFVAGPFYLVRENGRTRFKFNANPVLWGGRAGCLPRTTGPELRGKMFWFTAGGPLFSLLGALVAIPSWMFRDGHANVAFCGSAFGLMSAAILIGTLIPATVGGTTSDGARMLNLLRNRPEGMRWVAIGAVASLLNAERARDWPPELMALMGDGTDDKPDSVTVCMLQYLRLVDRREWDAAETWLERGLAKIDLVPAPLRSGLYACAAWFEARRRGSAAEARRYFDLASKPGLGNAKELHSIAAAVLIAEGRREEAAAELARAEATLSSRPPVLAESLREELAELRSALV